MHRRGFKSIGFDNYISRFQDKLLGSIAGKIIQYLASENTVFYGNNCVGWK
jgi:hypothetical protein